MNDDDIEILDIFDNNKKKDTEVSRVSKLDNDINKSNNKKEEEKVVPVKKKSSKRRIKKNAIQIVFCLISAIFLLSCVGIYGYRFIKYYRLYHPKAEDGKSVVLLANDIPGKTEYATGDEDGLFTSNGAYIYKGNVKNNYLKYNDMLWRIVRINEDKSIDIILDDYISILPWNGKDKSFGESEIYKYLNNDFLNALDKSKLTTTSFCDDKTDELNDIKNKCQKTDSKGYVKLLDIANFLNTINNGKSYLVDSDEIFWLSNYGSEKAWHTNGTNVSQSDFNIFNEVKPMVRLVSTTPYIKGDGTIENPYIIDKDNKLRVGSKVVLGKDAWIVYDNNDNVKLIRENVLEKQLEFDKEKLTYKNSSLMTYLNGTYLDSLPYKDMIVENTWYIGEYKTSIDDVKTDSVKAKVGIPNILDIKFDSKVKSYFTSTISEERVLVYENPLRSSRITTYRNIRPCITISKESANKLHYENGVFKGGE